MSYGRPALSAQTSKMESAASGLGARAMSISEGTTVAHDPRNAEIHTAVAIRGDSFMANLKPEVSRRLERIIRAVTGSIAGSTTWLSPQMAGRSRYRA